jgi:hypothetical protein
MGSSTIVHSLHIGEMTLILIENPEVIDDVESRCVIRSPCLLRSNSQSPAFFLDISL